MSIRGRLTFIVMMAAMVLVACGTVLISLQLRTRIAAQTDENLRSNAELVTEFVQTPEDPPSREELAQINGNPPDMMIWVLCEPDFQPIDPRDRPLLDDITLDRAKRGPTFTDASLGPHGDHEIRVFATPVQAEEDLFVIAVAQPSKPTHDLLVDRLPGAVVTAIAAVSAAGIGAWFVAGAALAPVDRLRLQAAALSVDDTDIRLDSPATRDEIAALANTLNDLLERLHGALRRERQLVADTAHELRTPLAALSTELELADRPGRSAPELRAAVQGARSDAARLSGLIDDLLFLARTCHGDLRLHTAVSPVEETIGRALRRSAPLVPAGAPTVITATCGNTVVEHDSENLERAFTNLISNAYVHAGDAAQIVITVDGTSDGAVTVTVADDGRGFPPAFLPHAFERFRQADEARSHTGTGLGLAIVKAITDAHGGTISASNAEPHGAWIRFTLPRRSAAGRLVTDVRTSQHT